MAAPSRVVKSIRRVGKSPAPQWTRRGFEPVLSEAQQLALTRYVDLMGEVKRRLDWLNHIIDGKTGLDPVIARESAYLQVRLTCETVALACLVAHGDIEETQAPKLQKEWSAAAIISALEKLHPEFFPVPRTPVSQGPGKWHFDYVQHEYLSKEQFLGVYGRSGDVLHRGHLKNVLSGEKPLEKELASVKATFDGLLGLLLVHHMPLFNGDQFVCFLNNAEGKVQAMIGQQRSA
jgi:hypothetical protein